MPSNLDLIITIILKENGGIAELRKDFNLYKKSYNNVLLNILVPRTLLLDQIERDGTTVGNVVKIGSLGIDNTGRTVKSKKPYIAKRVKETMIDGKNYVLYERRLPREFVLYEGEYSFITNILNIVTDEDGSRFEQITTSQKCNYTVLPSDYLDDEELTEPSELEVLAGRVDVVEEDTARTLQIAENAETNSQEAKNTANANAEVVAENTVKSDEALANSELALTATETYQENLQSEVNRATAAEALLQANIETEARVRADEDETLATDAENKLVTAKDYTDTKLTNYLTEQETYDAVNEAVASALGEIPPEIDLSGYETVIGSNEKMAQAEQNAKDFAQELADGKVDKMAGKQLSTNDFTNELKVTYDQHLKDTNNPHAVTAEQVGLGNVDNTSDLDKPVSNAVTTALGGKEPAFTVLPLSKGGTGATTAAAALINLGAEPTIATTGLPVSKGGTGRVSQTARGIVIGGTTTTAAQVSLPVGTAGQILQSGGSSANPSWITASPITAAAYVVEYQWIGSGGSGNNAYTNAWYRKWSDGLVEQGFAASAQVTTSVNITFTLPRAMPNASYLAIRGSSIADATTDGVQFQSISSWSRTTTAIGMRLGSTAYSPAFWYLVGR